MTIEEIAVDHDAALELAVLSELAVYDASYLWLSRELGAKLVTLDQQLLKAMTTTFFAIGGVLSRKGWT